MLKLLSWCKRNTHHYYYSNQSYAHGVSLKPLVYRTVGEHLRIITEQFPDNLAVASMHQNTEFTYSQFFEKANQLAAAFIALGLQKQDRIGIYSPNNYEWVLTQFAASLADLILVNINHAYQAKELQYALNKVQCKAIVTATSHKSSNYLEILKSLAPEIQEQKAGQLNTESLPYLKYIIKIDDEKENGMYNFKDLFQIYEPIHVKQLEERQRVMKPDDITNIQFTSGTTGYPKGASLTHFNIVNNGLFIGERLNFTSKDVYCIPAPLYHCLGMVLGNITAISYGAAMIYPSSGFNGKLSLEAVSKYKCTSILGVPTMFTEYLNEYKKNPTAYDLSRMRTGIIAGSLAPEILVKDIINILKVKELTNCYGMTETSPVSAQTKIDDTYMKRIWTVGTVMPHLEIKIVDDNGLIVPKGTPGEYCVRGYSLMKNYWNDPVQTKATMDDDGFLKSGDLAILDEDGYVSIVGRKKDLIIRGGENVYPKEIEDHLINMPGVEYVYVVGCIDEKFGEEIVALIKMKEGHSSLENIFVFQYCHKQISHYKIPKQQFQIGYKSVKFCDDFPYTVTGKPQKNKMKDAMNIELKDHVLEKKYKIR